ncbi:hypothetical protein WJR50_11175 [Catalinimonas sp. 4WD22]|uniref:hypothetical protein n=1 Tax=Catalinimonas locisalis TaxID=3133978 RepID=UPI0031013A41
MNNFLIKNTFRTNNWSISMGGGLSRKVVISSTKLLVALLMLCCSCEERASFAPDQFQEDELTQEEITLIQKRESLIIKYFGSVNSFNEAFHKALDKDRINNHKVAWSGDEVSAVLLEIFEERASTQDFKIFEELHHYSR